MLTRIQLGTDPCPYDPARDLRDDLEKLHRLRLDGYCESTPDKPNKKMVWSLTPLGTAQLP